MEVIKKAMKYANIKNITRYAEKSVANVHAVSQSFDNEEASDSDKSVKSDPGVIASTQHDIHAFNEKGESSKVALNEQSEFKLSENCTTQKDDLKRRLDILCGRIVDQGPSGSSTGKKTESNKKEDTKPKRDGRKSKETKEEENKNKDSKERKNDKNKSRISIAGNAQSPIVQDITVQNSSETSKAKTGRPKKTGKAKELDRESKTTSMPDFVIRYAQRLLARHVKQGINVLSDEEKIIRKENEEFITEVLGENAIQARMRNIEIINKAMEIELK